MVASKILDKLPPKWDLRIPDSNPTREDAPDEDNNTNCSSITSFNPDLTV